MRGLANWLDHLTHAQPGLTDGAPGSAVGRERVCGRRASKGAGLWDLFGSRDQLGHETRVGAMQPVLARISEVLSRRGQRDTRRLHVLEDPIYDLFVNA